ncbi:MAG TPA: bifunctional precorrin-2 dehydrogenase/sirohydrochlorin ferrochelatase [Bacilli bacterium]|nr:bifunctional precorrin-2 dehydrogenase/sirohydrochlorin ferrochelatase [Bacilli bacterium]
MRVAGRDCLVVGGGPVAERKVAGLLASEAQVTVVAPAVTNVIAEWAQEGTIEWEARLFAKEDVSDKFLIIAATDSQEINREVTDEAEKLGKLVNVVNDPDRGNFVVPAMVRRGKLQIGVSTSGAAPLVARRIRDELETRFGEEYAVYLDKLAEVRQVLLRDVLEVESRRAIWHRVVESDLLSLLRDGRLEEADRRIVELIGGL